CRDDILILNPKSRSPALVILPESPTHALVSACHMLADPRRLTASRRWPRGQYSRQGATDPGPGDRRSRGGGPGARGAARETERGHRRAGEKERSARSRAVTRRTDLLPGGARLVEISGIPA